MTHQSTSSETGYSRWGRLRRIGGVSALITGALLLIGMINLIILILQPRATNGWLSLFGNNWLIKIFILHAEFKDIHAVLQGLNFLDIFILFLVSVICVSISTVFRNARKTWLYIAFALSVIAIVLFLVTQNAGRSTVMLAVLIISFVMLRDKTFSQAIIYIGILASVFLFIGDLTVGVHSNLITILFGIGYVLMTTWFFLMAQRLCQLGENS